MSKWIKQGISILIAAALLLPTGWRASDVRADAQEPEATETVYHETFETGVGKAVQSGSASISHVSIKRLPAMRTEALCM